MAESLQVILVLRAALNVDVARVPVAILGGRLRSPMRPNAKLGVPEPFGNLVSLQPLTGPVEGALLDRRNNPFATDLRGRRSAGAPARTAIAFRLLIFMNSSPPKKCPPAAATPPLATGSQSKLYHPKAAGEARVVSATPTGDAPPQYISPAATEPYRLRRPQPISHGVTLRQGGDPGRRPLREGRRGFHKKIPRKNP